MKKLFTLMILAASSVTGLGSAVAQAADYEYVPLVREGMEWKCKYIDPYSDPQAKPVDKFYKLKLTGDTVMNGMTYKKCWYFTDCECDISKLIPAAYLREQDKRVYMQWNKAGYKNYDGHGAYYVAKHEDEQGNEVEFTLYDFNVSAGDVLDGSKDVRTVETVEVDGKLRKKFGIYVSDIIEGVGAISAGDMLTPYGNSLTSELSMNHSTVYTADMSTKHLEYKADDTTVIDDCSAGAVATVQAALNAKIIAVQGGVSVSVPETVGIAAIEVVDMAGNVVETGYCSDSQATTVLIAAGAYIVNVTDGSSRATAKVIVK